MKTLILSDVEVENIINVSTYIEKNLKYHKTIVELAKMATMSVTKFKRGFRQMFGMGPLQYLAEKRIKYAQEELLANEEISSIAYKVGFSGGQARDNFIKFFKKKVGLPPATWRKEYAKKVS